MNNHFQPSGDRHDVSNDASKHTSSSSLDALYASLKSQDIEQFYQGYTAWTLRQRLAALEAQLAQLDQRINDNAVLMQIVQPSALSLAALSRLQSYGVDDINLLDTMLERGDEWLDHAMQLLSQCERLGLIHDNYTEWCHHALDGAYEWIDTMNEANFLRASRPDTSPSATTETTQQPSDASSDGTTELLLRKLMSDDETNKTATTTDAFPFQQATLPEELSTPEQGALITNQNTATAEVDVGTAEIEVPISTSIEQREQVEGEPVATIEVSPQPNISGTSEQESAELTAQDISDEENETDSQDTHTHKSPGRTLVARLLAKVWNVS